jgi:Tryptophan halogenase
MNIVIVGGGTAGWATALMAAKRHPYHKITVIESTKIGIVGVGESTTGRMTDILTNVIQDFGCDHDEFIAETGATLKYAIYHKGWTNNIDQGYIGPIDGSWTRDASPDALFSWGLLNLKPEELMKVAKCGNWIYHGKSNFSKTTKKFKSHSHAMHVDAKLVGQYFKKVTLRNNNAAHIDGIVKEVRLDSENGFVESLVLENGQIVNGDFFIDCSGFNKVLMNKVAPGKWISYSKNLPINTGLPFQLDYKEGEVPESYTTAWAQKNGWMWQIPLMDRKGCGYVFCDAFTTPDKAQEEIETILGRKIDPVRTIKFDPGRQEQAWVKNVVAIGLSSAFLEPLEATSIHSTIVQGHNLVYEYLKDDIIDTMNEGSRRIYNQRTSALYDDIKDFLILHYMGGRNDSEFWKMISSGVTKTPFVDTLLHMGKSKIPTFNDFPNYSGSAGWPLYSYVMAGLNLLNKHPAKVDLEMNMKYYGRLHDISTEAYYNLQDEWKADMSDCYSYEEFIKYFRDLRYKNGISDIKY